jgi:hypothetical protein
VSFSGISRYRAFSSARVCIPPETQYIAPCSYLFFLDNSVVNQAFSRRTSGRQYPSSHTGNASPAKRLDRFRCIGGSLAVRILRHFRKIIPNGTDKRVCYNHQCSCRFPRQPVRASGLPCPDHRGSETACISYHCPSFLSIGLSILPEICSLGTQSSLVRQCSDTKLQFHK